MPGTFSQLYTHVVFAVSGRRHDISPDWKGELFKYMSGIVTSKGQKSIIVNGMTDHVHMFIGMRPSACLSDLVRDVKNNSSKFVNDHFWMERKFTWQEGFGAFSYGHSQISAVYEYIKNQEKVHQKKSFKEEYLALLRKFEIEFNEKYVF